MLIIKQVNSQCSNYIDILVVTHDIVDVALIKINIIIKQINYSQEFKNI